MWQFRALVGVVVAGSVALIGAAPAGATAVGTSPGYPGFLFVYSDAFTVSGGAHPINLPPLNVTITRTSANDAELVESKNPLLPLSYGLIPSLSKCSYAGSLLRMRCHAANIPVTIVDGSSAADRVDVISPVASAHVSGLEGDDAISLASGPDTFNGSRVHGGDGNDTLTLSHAAGTAMGYADGAEGNDFIISKPGPDMVKGGLGSDRIEVADGDNADVILCADPQDVVSRDPGDTLTCF